MNISLEKQRGLNIFSISLNIIELIFLSFIFLFTIIKSKKKDH